MIIAALALFLLAASVSVSTRALALTFVAIGTFIICFRLAMPAAMLLILVPFVALANLEAWTSGWGVYPSEVVLLAALAAVALRHPTAVRFAGPARFALAYGLWVSVAALAATLLAGTADIASLARIARLGFFATTLFALGFSLAARYAVRWARAAALAAGLIGAAAIGEALLRAGGGGVPRTGSPVGGPELLALHLSLLIPPGLVLALDRQERHRSLTALLLVAGVGLVLSFSRSGWLGAWAAILGMGLAALKAERGIARRLFGLAGVVLLGGALTAAGLAELGGDAFAAYSGRLRTLATLDILADRRADWQLGVSAIRTHPWFGSPTAPNPYNLILALAATSGLPVLVPFALLVISAIASGLATVARGGAAALLAVGFLGALIALLVAGMGESTLGARLTPPAFTALGLLSGLGARSHGAGSLG